ncbi:MAG: M48 family metallopeptidase [Bacteroidales bacterium]|nr:M48 family metallopeptidase [Bacteroidales bacterium]
MKNFYYTLLTVVLFTACGTLNQMNLFSIEDEKTFGNQMYAQIQETPKDYPLLDPAKHAAAYAHVTRILQTLLNSGQVNYAKEFEWSIRIIDADVLNAFACPGGKVYVYKGLINFLDNEAQLAGVIAHEIGHIANRHSTRQMTKQYGMSALTDMLLGQNPNQYVQMATQLAGGVGSLAFSRSDEYEADNSAVRYLSATDYNPLGVAGFFKKMIANGEAGGSSLTWLSTHPSPPDRIQKIQEAWVAYGSKKGDDFVARYSQLKAALPK